MEKKAQKEYRAWMGARIREARIALGITQREFGRRVGVSRVTVCRWESGAKCPDSYSCREIFRVCGVRIFSEDEACRS